MFINRWAEYRRISQKCLSRVEHKLAIFEILTFDVVCIKIISTDYIKYAWSKVVTISRLKGISFVQLCHAIDKRRVTITRGINKTILFFALLAMSVFVEGLL